MGQGGLVYARCIRGAQAPLMGQARARKWEVHKRVLGPVNGTSEAP